MARIAGDFVLTFPSWASLVRRHQIPRLEHFYEFIGEQFYRSRCTGHIAPIGEVVPYRIPGNRRCERCERSLAREARIAARSYAG